jgi:hypothetical protein
VDKKESINHPFALLVTHYAVLCLYRSNKLSLHLDLLHPLINSIRLYKISQAACKDIFGNYGIAVCSFPGDSLPLSLRILNLMQYEFMLTQETLVSFLFGKETVQDSESHVENWRKRGKSKYQAFLSF